MTTQQSGNHNPSNGEQLSEEEFIMLQLQGKPIPRPDTNERLNKSWSRPPARNRSLILPTRRKKTHHEEPENHERWLVSYADFITLLFAFFVVMYAISSVNDGKYRALSQSVEAAFHTEPRSSKPIQVGEIARSPVTTPIPIGTQPIAGQQALELISQEIEENLAEFMEKDLIGIRRGKLWLEVEIKTSLLFPSGSSLLETKSLPILSELAAILKNFPNLIHVGGFTDDRPISSVIYPSNWELSAGRAASVVHLFNKLGVNPDRMAAVGYGEYRPTADNSTPEGRNKNRRVVLHILANSVPPQHGVDSGVIDSTNY